MRLRLSVQRHALPQVDLVWGVPDDPAHATTTVSQLLTEVNDIVPLESEAWGLEDYVAQLGSFELLHFSRLSQILKDEDHVTIRPIQTVEVRERTLTGRLQIDSGGRHLIDGVPFGRQLLRRPVRPIVHIPSPDISTALPEAMSENQLAIAPRGSEDIDVASRNPAANEDMDVDGEDVGNYNPPLRPRKRQRRNSNTPDRSERSVHFEDGGAPGNDQALFAFPSDDDNTEDEFHTDGDSDTSSGSESATGNTSVSSGSSEASSSSESEEPSGSESSDDSSAVNLASDTSSSEDESSDDSSALDLLASDLSSSEDESSDSEPEHLSSKTMRPVSGIASDTTAGVQNPKSNDGNGPETEAGNNQRIRRVPPGQGLKEMREWEAAHGVPNHRLTATFNMSNREEVSEPSSRTLSNDVPAASNEEEILEKTRQRLLTKLGAASTPGLIDGVGETEQAPSVEVRAVSMDNTQQATGTSTSPEVSTAKEATSDRPSEELSEQSTPKRARLDLSGARRMLFGSLGVRNPKTKEEEEKLQKRLAAKQAKKAIPIAQPEETEQEDKSPTDPELWKKKVKLMAFECCDEGVELSAPPFPFQQRWDPQQQLRPKGKKRKRKQRTNQEEGYYGDDGEYYEDEGKYYEGEGEYYDVRYYDDSYYADGAEDGWEGLDYDDPVGTATNDAAESQLLQDAATTTLRSESPDLPIVPENHSTLPVVDLTTANAGDVITFKRFEMSAATGWEPSVSDARSARVEEVTEEGAIVLKLAKRDRPQKKIQYDSRGNRLYDRFEMAGVTEDEEEGFLELDITDVLDPRLLQAAAQPASCGDGNGEKQDEIAGEDGAATVEEVTTAAITAE
ncbi:hypothetical protein K490DRAFT_62509 [Saccharata proteae CBS 121410]|uniref:DUF7357 domain-containing protein n=1 Tax=Saccharata proteae CBS 121410 TaxID=1314787 RepID=A0A9P4I2X3_9PEZI|nr:hypothetical protein K490DRAFT_62509 [Saccharata proteae CBS 121410]